MVAYPEIIGGNRQDLNFRQIYFDLYRLNDALSGLKLNRTAVATSYTALLDDYLIGVTSTAAARTITLPARALEVGKHYVVKDESGGAAANNITIDPEGTVQIDGGATATISTNYGVVRLYSDGSKWFTW